MQACAPSDMPRYHSIMLRTPVIPCLQLFNPARLTIIVQQPLCGILLIKWQIALNTDASEHCRLRQAPEFDVIGK